jgi:ribosomal protein L40E
VSHLPERKEKICLNCNAELQGRFCHQCGQENLEPKESLWHLITHFFNDITHFDGKFFSTSKLLLFRPGFLPAEYMKGRRASYLNPIRMYVFTSAFFFLLFFSFFFDISEENMGENFRLTNEIAELYGEADSANLDFDSKGNLVINKDTVGNLNDKVWLSRFKDSLKNVLAQRKDTASKATVKENKKEKKTGFVLIGGDEIPLSRAEYDSVQNTLPESERDGWFTRAMAYRVIEVNEKYGGNQGKFFAALANKFAHLFPTMLFFSLPLFALLLRLLYIRRKEYYFVSHGIFSIHLYIFTFITLLVFFIAEKLDDNTGWGIWGWVKFIIFLLMFFYLYKAMRKFYRQGRGKTILKFIILNILSIILTALLFTAFGIYTLLKV